MSNTNKGTSSARKQSSTTPPGNVPPTSKDLREETSFVDVAGRVFVAPIAGALSEFESEIEGTFRGLNEIRKQGGALNAVKAVAIGIFSVPISIVAGAVKSVYGLFNGWRSGTEGIAKRRESVLASSASNKIVETIGTGIGIAAVGLFTIVVAPITQYFAGIVNGVRASINKGLSLIDEGGFFNTMRGALTIVAGIVFSPIWNATLKGVYNALSGIAYAFRERKDDLKPKDRSQLVDNLFGSRDLDVSLVIEKERDMKRAQHIIDENTKKGAPKGGATSDLAGALSSAAASAAAAKVSAPSGTSAPPNAPTILSNPPSTHTPLQADPQILLPRGSTLTKEGAIKALAHLSSVTITPLTTGGEGLNLKSTNPDDLKAALVRIVNSTNPGEKSTWNLPENEHFTKEKVQKLIDEANPPFNGKLEKVKIGKQEYSVSDGKLMDAATLSATATIVTPTSPKLNN